jgi:hypothetical protein
MFDLKGLKFRFNSKILLFLVVNPLFQIRTRMRIRIRIYDPDLPKLLELNPDPHENQLRIHNHNDP